MSSAWPRCPENRAPATNKLRKRVGEHQGLALAPLLHAEVAHKGTLDLCWGTCPLIVASEVAARGLDIKDVRHVITYDLPHEVPGVLGLQQACILVGGSARFLW
ncbi:hypothetical protein MRX96_019015 [Rhipicephalus microplus]